MRWEKENPNHCFFFVYVKKLHPISSDIWDSRIWFFPYLWKNQISYMNLILKKGKDIHLVQTSNLASQNIFGYILFFWPYMNTFLYIKSLMFIFLNKRNKNKNLIVMFACIFIYRSVWWCVHVHRTPRLSIIFIWSVTYINNLTINIWHLSFVDSIGEKVEFLIVTLVKLGKDNIWVEW